jgi:hypothetical protein
MVTPDGALGTGLLPDLCVAALALFGLAAVVAAFAPRSGTLAPALSTVASALV